MPVPHIVNAPANHRHHGENLLAEGIAKERIDLIGNIMIDSYVMLRDKIEASTIRDDLGIGDQDYALVTLHRPSNVDTMSSLQPIVEQLLDISEGVPVLFVAHPRTLNSLDAFELIEKMTSNGRVQLLDPLPYVSFMNVVIGAKLVITDSGGLQEETTFLDIPCLTLRENTERPITISQGTNRLVSADNLAASVNQILDGNWPAGSCPPLWDGKTAARAVECLRHRSQSMK